MCNLKFQDEIINLPESALASVLPGPPHSHISQPAMLTEVHLEEVTETIPAPERDSKETSDHVSLNPPQALFRPIDYPPLHIFVSISKWLLEL